MNSQQAWQAAIGQLQMEMPKASYETWVRSAELVSFEDGIFTVGVPNAYARDWLESRLTSTITRILSGLMEETQKISFIVWHKDYQIEEKQKETAPVLPLTISQPTQFSALNSKYTFDNFITGSSNRLAHAACLAVAENPAQAYNPLFVYGGVGLGKTHLLHAIGNSCHSNGLNVLYVSSEEFTNDMINAIRTHTTQAFREKYRSADVLLIDDIQFIAGKEGTQEEFFHTFNTLHSQDKQIIVSSDRPPKSMVTLEERLRSRFEWGLIADIQIPDIETRQAILRYKAEKNGRVVPNEILEMIARRVHSNIRELEGALNRIIAFSELSGVPLSLSLAEMALADLLPQVRNVAPQKLIALVANEWQTSVEALLSRDRSQRIAEPRQVAMYLLRQETNASLPQIGEAMGGRDHTTVMYAIQKITSDIQIKKDMERKVNRIKQQLYGQAGLAA
ncbi:MAG: chromosomal replication initiator protein DnaA [Anaerolineaceae bacterium]|nr:chromosomal replication initiator protein DnaA [Anaerolineaceae bacterium]